jgi:hypothetical protein
MEHFTVDQTCKHGGCEMAITFLSFPMLSGIPSQLYAQSMKCQTRQTKQNIYSFFAFSFSLISRPFLMRSRMFSRSLSSFNLVMTTFEG